jgi:hypothetical protein
MPRASVMILRTIISAAQHAPVVAATSDSSARRVLSRQTLYQPPYAARRATLSSTLSKGPYSTELGERLQEWPSTNGGTSSRCGRQRRRRPLDESGDTTQSKSSACSPSSAHMTTTHRVPGPGLGRPPASLQGQAIASPFFEPVRDRVARDAEGPSQPAQRTAFSISTQDLFACFYRVGVCARLLAAALLAIAAQVTLSAIGGQSIANQIEARAMLTS